MKNQEKNPHFFGLIDLPYQRRGIRLTLC